MGDVIPPISLQILIIIRDITFFHHLLRLLRGIHEAGGLFDFCLLLLILPRLLHHRLNLQLPLLFLEALPLNLGLVDHDPGHHDLSLLAIHVLDYSLLLVLGPPHIQRVLVHLTLTLHCAHA